MRVAAIDCGTNSIRLLIADIHDGQFKEVDRRMEVVRLGQGVDKNKAFDPEAIERTLTATSAFARVIASKGVEKIRFCATSASTINGFHFGGSARSATSLSGVRPMASRSAERRLKYSSRRF